MQIINYLRSFILLTISMIISPWIVIAQEETGLSKDSVKIENQLPGVINPDNEVVTGYIVRHRKEMTGSYSTVEPARLVTLPAGNVGNLLQGRASGVIVTGSGQPGEPSKVRIRGFSSFSNNNPLYIVDGVPMQDISLINPYDVASVTILKDAGETSIFGSRSSNGVIVVTTRHGENRLNMDYNMSTGIQNPGKGTADDVLTTTEYANLQWLVYKNDGIMEINPIFGSSQNPTPSIPSWAANTDWYDAITEPAMIRNHHLAISGGSEKAEFYAGLGVHNQDGIIIYTFNKRYSVRLNSEFNLLKNRIKTGENLTFSDRIYLSAPNSIEDNPVLMVPYRSPSIIPVIIDKPISGLMHEFVPGEWGGTGISTRLGNASNPVADLTRRKDDKSRDSYLTGSLWLDLMILEGFNFRSTTGGTLNKATTVNNTYASYERAWNGSVAGLHQNTFQTRDWIWTNLLTFDRKLGNNKIFALAGYEAVSYGMGLTIADSDTNDYTPTRLLSSFVKAGYSFRNRYLINVTLRRDGCSRFSASERYGYFPSFSIGWRIGDESFLNRLKCLNELKIRGSWGITGNQFALSPQNAFFLFGESPGASYYDLYGTSNSSVRGYYTVRPGNPDQKWEATTITDFGLDAGFFNNRIKIVLDWYLKDSEDLLFNPPIPGTAGAGETPFINVASMENSGIDLELVYHDDVGELGINATLLFTTYSNRITRIATTQEYFSSGETDIGYLVRNEAEHPLSSFYGYQVRSLFQNYAEVQSAPYQSGATPGFFRFENTNTTGTWGSQYIDYLDRTYLGDPNPEFTYGFNLQLTWKNFDLNAFLYGSQGNDIFNYNRYWTDFWQSYPGQKSKDLLYNSWTETNRTATIPKASSIPNFSTNQTVCSYYIEDGSYLRMKNLQFGYTFPQSITGKLKINSLRIFLQAVNLFTITGYSGLDPELGGSDLAFGIDFGNYPTATQFIFGIDLSI